MNNKSKDSIKSLQKKLSEIGSVSQSHPITVLQVLPSLGQSGGVERGTVDMAAGIVKAGGRAIVASEGGSRVYELKRCGAEHVTLALASKNPFIIYRNAHLLAKLIRTEQIDIVHVRSRAPAWSTLWACRWTKTPFVTTFHGAYGHTNPLKRSYNRVMVKGKLVIAISHFIAEHINQVYGIPTDYIRIIHRGVDLKTFSPKKVNPTRIIHLATKWRLPDGYPIIMLPGRLTRLKGQIVLIKAIAKLARQDVRCLLIGSDQGRKGYRKELEKLIRIHHLDSVVHIIEGCRDMPAAYMLADVVVSASTSPEAFGRVITEAQAMGRPVIATDHGGARETIIEGNTGWLVPSRDIQCLADRLVDVLALTPKKREALGKRAIKNVESHFSKENMTAKTLAVYSEILSSITHSDNA